jgi:hypothetical protein
MATLTILVSGLLPHKSVQVDQYAAQGEQRAQGELRAV